MINLQKNEKKVILYLDESQSVGEVCKNYVIEAAIREAVQHSDNIAFVFSGSNRHLIENMFHEEKKPFYNLCDTIILDRISQVDYKSHLEKASLDKWNKSFPEDIRQRIFTHTEAHSYYFNKLCSMLWQGDLPTIKDVDYYWNTFIAENRSVVERELSLLTMNQRKILTFIAMEGGIQEPFGKVFLSKINLSSSSAARAIEVLVK